MIANKVLHEQIRRSQKETTKASQTKSEQLIAFLMHICTEYRGILLTIFVLPISVAVNTLWYIRMQLALYFADPAKHQGKVEAVADAVKKSIASGKKICTARPGWQSMSLKMGDHKKGFHLVPTHLLVDILGIHAIGGNKDDMVVSCEPLVSMGQLSRYLVARGYTLPVVPELDELTVGGLLMGFGIESSSHKYGLFQEICVEYELVLGDGRVVVVRADNEYKDLFYALPWSHGTLGLMVRATLRIVKSKPLVRLQHTRVSGIENVVKKFTEITSKPNAATFIEVLLYENGDGVLMEGEMVDSVASDGKYYDLGKWFQPWFYKHVLEITKGTSPSTSVIEYIPLRSYYHRHTRGIFWEMEHIIPFADQMWFRYLLGWAMPPNIPLLKIFQTAHTKKMWREQFVVQDMLVPITSLTEVLQDIDKNLAVYPMWLCPHLVCHHAEGGLVGEVSRAGTKEMYVDIGLYGVPKRQPFVHDVALRRLEEVVRRHRGYQGMYAVSYMDRSEFDTMFHRELYDQCRAKYGAVDKFPDVFEKTCPKAEHDQMKAASKKE